MKDYVYDNGILEVWFDNERVCLQNVNMNFSILFLI